jgi:hypothetical protein
MCSIDGKIPKHSATQMALAFSRCNDERRSISLHRYCWCLLEYRLPYEELHVVRASKSFFAPLARREMRHLDTPFAELHWKNFLDAIQSVGYNTSRCIFPRLQEAPVTARCRNEHAPTVPPEMVQRLASIITEKPSIELWPDISCPRPGHNQLVRTCL